MEEMPATAPQRPVPTPLGKIWLTLTPTQQEQVRQIVVQICYRLVTAWGKEGPHESARNVTPAPH